MSLGLLERAAEIQRAQLVEVGDSYSELVEAIADDTFDGDPESVIEVCGTAGRTLAELNADVEALARRRELATVAAGKGPASARIKAIGVALAESEAKREAVLKEHHATFSKLMAEKNQLDGVVMRADSARRELLQSIPPHLRNRKAEINTRDKAAAALINSLREKLHAAKETLQHTNQKITDIVARKTPDEQSKLTALQASLHGHEKAVRDVEKRISAAEHDRAECATAIQQFEAEAISG